MDRAAANRLVGAIRRKYLHLPSVGQLTGQGLQLGCDIHAETHRRHVTGVCHNADRVVLVADNAMVRDAGIDYCSAQVIRAGRSRRCI